MSLPFKASTVGVPVIEVTPPVAGMPATLVTGAVPGVPCRVVTAGPAIPINTVGGPPPPAATWDPAAHATGVVLSNGNLTATQTVGSIDLSGLATKPISGTDKVYYEINVGDTSTQIALGLGNSSTSLNSSGSGYLGVDTNSFGWFSSGGVLFNNSTIATFATFTTGDVLGFAVNFATGAVQFFKNNVSQGTLTPGIVGSLFPAFDLKYNSSTVPTVTANFHGPFTFTPPSGFTAYG